MSLNRILWVVIAAALLFPFNAFSQEEVPTPELPIFEWSLGWAFLIDDAYGEPYACLVHDNVTLERAAAEVERQQKEALAREAKRKGPPLPPPPKRKAKAETEEAPKALELDLRRSMCLRFVKRTGYTGDVERKLDRETLIAHFFNKGYRVVLPTNFVRMNAGLSDNSWEVSLTVGGYNPQPKNSVVHGTQTLTQGKKTYTATVYRPAFQ